MLENRAPAGRVSERAVNENDCGLGHQASFSLGGLRSQPALIVPSSRPWFALVRCPCPRAAARSTDRARGARASTRDFPGRDALPEEHRVLQRCLNHRRAMVILRFKIY